MNLWKTIIVAILLVLLAFNIVGLQIGWTLKNTLLQPSFYREVFKQQEAYGQMRQLMFRLVYGNLPNGQESLPYLEKAISEDWIEEQVDIILKDFLSFSKGETNDVPILPFYKLKEKVAGALKDDKTQQEKMKIVDYWFDPLPDTVRLQDFMSMDMLWNVRENIIMFMRLLWILLGSLILITVVLYIVIAEWKQVALWIATAIITAGALIVGITLATGWILDHSSLVIGLVDHIVAIDIPRRSANQLLATFQKGLITPINIIGVLSIILGGIAIYFIPIEERVLTLIK